MENKVDPRIISAQIAVIEQIYEIRFANREDIIRWTAGLVHDERQVLTVTSALNNWVAVHGLTGRVILERNDFDRMTRDIRW